MRFKRIGTNTTLETNNRAVIESYKAQADIYEQLDADTEDTGKTPEGNWGLAKKAKEAEEAAQKAAAEAEAKRLADEEAAKKASETLTVDNVEYTRATLINIGKEKLYYLVNKLGIDINGKTDEEVVEAIFVEAAKRR